MDLPKDFKEFIQSLNAKGVEFVIVGGIAMARHGHPRYTGDMDVLINPNKDNAHKLISALKDFGFSFSDITAHDFTDSKTIVQLGVPPLRIDLITSIDGVSNEEVFRDCISDTQPDIALSFISREHLIKNKAAAGRPKDLADVASLQLSSKASSSRRIRRKGKKTIP
ncbi:MAG: nucleotidyltransferase [Candidatus Sumerlaeota bacterium]|nr:nucleotidyltransferase [Candidatus Sumerlaeota bacterium]